MPIDAQKTPLAATSIERDKWRHKALMLRGRAADAVFRLRAAGYVDTHVSIQWILNALQEFDKA